MASMAEDLILASASLTRARLLVSAGIAVRIEPADIDEEAVKSAFRAEHRGPVDCALALAQMKALVVSRRNRRAVVIGADQILVCGGTWFDKPTNPGAARAQLKTLCGCTHQLATAACVVQNEAPIWRTVSLPELTMRIFSEAFLDEYMEAEGASVLGSVGAYRLEGRGVQLFTHIEGDHFAVLGLPLLELLGFLRDRGLVLA
jgi:septum formation protein